MNVSPRIEMDTVRGGYVDLCQTLRDHGRYVEPRGLPCRELTGVTLVVHNPLTDAMPVGLGRRLNIAIGACEALQLIGGVSTPHLLTSVSPNFLAFREGEAFYGAYGPRVAAQLCRVQDQLVDDPDTRQAIAAIWREGDAWARTKDLPCTLSFQFLLRDDALELVTTMRSNDVWRGWAYDAFQFTRLQQVMADSLAVGVGPYTHHAGSLHLYASDLTGVETLDPTPNYSSVAAALIGAGVMVQGPQAFSHYQAAAQNLLAGDADDSDVGGWYERTLRPWTRPK